MQNVRRTDPASRAVRVFISSTFRDMHEEREILVKRVFPELRRLGVQRSVSVTEVDLRWGVTDEQKAEGRVLPIILEEIERCRPYFIGILGERYGWMPEDLPAELGARPKRSWWRRLVAGSAPAAAFTGRSVTELEILRGVLDDPEMAEHAFFYFRSPEYIGRVPREKRADCAAESPEAAQKLKDLKKRIRASGFTVRENYRDPAEMGELVLRNLTAVIDKLYPDSEAPGSWSGRRRGTRCSRASAPRCTWEASSGSPRLTGTQIKATMPPAFS